MVAGGGVPSSQNLFKFDRQQDPQVWCSSTPPSPKSSTKQLFMASFAIIKIRGDQYAELMILEISVYDVQGGR